MADFGSQQRKLQILCLHGSRQDGEVFSQRLKTLQKKLKSIAVSGSPQVTCSLCSCRQSNCSVDKLSLPNSSQAIAPLVALAAIQNKSMLHVPTMAPSLTVGHRHYVSTTQTLPLQLQHSHITYQLLQLLAGLALCVSAAHAAAAGGAGSADACLVAPLARQPQR
jgi:hypothetical protein